MAFFTKRPPAMPGIEPPPPPAPKAPVKGGRAPQAQSVKSEEYNLGNDPSNAGDEYNLGSDPHGVGESPIPSANFAFNCGKQNLEAKVLRLLQDFEALHEVKMFSSNSDREIDADGKFTGKLTRFGFDFKC